MYAVKAVLEGILSDLKSKTQDPEYVSSPIGYRWLLIAMDAWPTIACVRAYARTISQAVMSLTQSDAREGAAASQAEERLLRHCVTDTCWRQ